MISQQSSAQGLVFIYLEAGPDVNETDLNAWYDNEHAPLRLTVPGFMSAIRYKAVDSQNPKWLTLYDIETPEAANSDAYNALRAQGSDNEKAILSKLGGLSRRSYLHMGTFTHPDTKPEELPSKYVFVVSLEMTPEGEDELNKWYDEEHMDLLSKIPGWKAGRKRGELADQPVAKYLAIHELSNNDFLSTPEFKHATSTEWRARVMKNAVRREVRIFELHKDFGKSKV
ncbi:hypothetical protein B0H17DRAFT_1142454 [Mycena rosella]|uniref:Uncharacterized protein n=1 Tax=Mycena rosella TaxID=1033263 RepID=A0AAD7CYL7_MYCRO|nr:hypothetical protein B0H17DRAFT_1142454 [Mycena rosella]